MSTGAELQDQGIKLFMQREYESAADLFKQAKAAYETEGKKDLSAEMQVNLGLIDRVGVDHVEPVGVDPDRGA